MVHTFNEGEELPTGRTKQSVITPTDGQPIAIAVICEEWVSGAERLWTSVQVTTPANTLISRITDRMPTILPREGVKAVLRTFEDGGAWTMTEQAPSGRKAKPKTPQPQQDLI